MHLTLRSIFVFLIILCVHKVNGQVRQADSLKLILQKETDPLKRVDLSNDIAYLLYDFNDSAAFQYAQEALSSAVEIKYPKGVKYAYSLIGLGYFSKGDMRQALQNLHLSGATKAENANDREAYNDLLTGIIHFELAQYDSAKLLFTLALQKTDSVKDPNSTANLYRSIGNVLLTEWKNEEAYRYLQKAERLLKSAVTDHYIQTEIYHTLGVYYENKITFDKAEMYYSKMCSLADQSGDIFHLIKCELRKSELAYRVGDYANALLYCSKALHYSGSYAYPPQITEIYTRFGDIYTELSQHDLAIKYYFQALKISEKLSLRRWTSEIYSGLSWIYFERKDNEQALSYIDRAEKIRKEIGDPRGLGNCYNVRGLIFRSQKNYSLAIQQFEKAISIWQSIGHQEGVSAVYYNLSEVYDDQKNPEKALAVLREALLIEEKIGNIKELGTSYNQLADLLIKVGHLTEAEKYLKTAEKLAYKSGSLLQKRYNARYFASLYTRTGDLKKANEYLLRYADLGDSVFSESSSVKLAEMEALYRVEQKDQEIKLLNQEGKLKENQLKLQDYQIRQQKIISITSILGFLIVSLIAFKIYQFNERIKKANRNISEQNEEIQTQSEELTESNRALSELNFEIVEKNEEIQAQSEELTEAHQTILEINKNLEGEIESRTADLKQAYHELDTFFYRSSHDFRRPLTTFMGLAEVAKITVKDPNALELFEKVRETANNLDKMLVKLQSISDVGSQQLIYKEVFLSELFDGLVDNFRSELVRKNIQIDTKVNVRKPFYSYPALVKIIVENLFENAISFCGVADPFIRMTVTNEANDIVIIVQDNGQGIDQQLQRRIFEMYFRGNERSKGNGLGLYIVHKAVEKLKGRIEFESSMHAGSIFKVYLPNQTA